MSKGHSPSFFNGEADSFYDPDFTLDINRRMQVPKTIRIGDFIEDDLIGTNGSGWNHVSNDKCEMSIPERIIVVGQEQYAGTKAIPTEITLDRAALPTTEPSLVRVQTPPRVLKLDEHYFPAVDEDERNSFANDSFDTENIPLKKRAHFNTETQVVRHVRESTPYGALDVSLTPSEEIQHLRRQVGKLNRRVMAVELEMNRTQQREKTLYAATIVYFIVKVFLWLNRN